MTHWTHSSHHQTTSPQSPLVLEMMDLDNAEVQLAPGIWHTNSGPRRSEIGSVRKLVKII